MIELRALGTAEIHTGSATITPSQEIVFAAALYLIIERGTNPSRSKVASLLWPRASEESRAHRLRQTILQLKKLGIVVHADRTKLCLPVEGAHSDFDDLPANAADLLERHSVEFLPGYIPRWSEPFGDWLDSKRGELHALITRALIRELDRDRRQGNWPAVEKISAKCLILDPYNEAAVLAQAESAAMRGAKLHAISLLDRYIADVGNSVPELKVPATILRRRVVDRVPDRPALANAEPPFVGREPEMEILSRGLERARGRNGSALVIVGEPGIGKSRLSAEFGRFAELQGARIQRATCRRTDLGRPLSLFVDMVPQLRELPGALGCAPETFAWLKRLTEFEQRPDDSSRPFDSETLFQNVRGALFDLLDSVSQESCLVILLEDIQWLDDASTKILARMVEWCETRRVFIVANSRPGANTFLDYAKKVRLESVALGALSSAASTALLQSLVQRSADASQQKFVRWCLGVAEGNPFFLQELAHQWIETGHRYEAPPSVSKVLQERLSRLTVEALQVLQVCSVLGEWATIERVEGVLMYRPHQLLSAVEELSNAAMLVAHPEGSESSDRRLHPRHDFLASAAIGRLSPLSLAFLHQRSADVLDKEIPRTGLPTTLLWACANHSHLAGNRKRALSLALSCAQHLLDVGLSEDACKRYQDSLAYCSSDEDRIAVMGPLAVACQINGEWERSKDALRTCVRLSSVAEHPEPHNEFEIQLFQARHRSDLDFVALLADILPCVESSSATPQHRVSAAVVALKLASDVGPSALLDRIYSEIEALLKLDQVDPVSRLEAEIIYRTMRTTDDIDVQRLEEFTAAARSCHGEIAYSHALLACSSACRIAAKDSEALRFCSMALDHAIEHKMRARIPVIRLAAIRLYVAACDWTGARVALTLDPSYPIPDDDRNTLAEWDFYDARVALQQGDLSTAERAISRFGTVPQSFSANRRAACLALLLRLRLAKGDSLDPIRLLVQDLEATHTVNQDIGNQDFEAHALFLGLAALGEEKRGWAQLHNYIYRHRSSRRSLSRDIQDLLINNDVGISRERQPVANTF